MPSAASKMIFRGRLTIAGHIRKRCPQHLWFVRRLIENEIEAVAALFDLEEDNSDSGRNEDEKFQ
jgi:hypothetical protein